MKVGNHGSSLDGFILEDMLLGLFSFLAFSYDDRYALYRSLRTEAYLCVYLPKYHHPRYCAKRPRPLPLLISSRHLASGFSANDGPLLPCSGPSMLW